MRVKPEDLKVANKVASIKETGTSQQKRNYWNGVHRLRVQGQNLQLLTNDGATWLEWNIPIEGEPSPIDCLVPEGQFDYAARYLEGGALEVQDSDGLVDLTKDSLHYKLRKETPQTYPDPEIGENAKEWTCESQPLAASLKFVNPFIDETNPAANKSVATVYEDGLMIAGNPKRFAMVKGLNVEVPMAFKTKTAKAVAVFLDSIGETVKITVTNRCYIFEDPDGGHKITVLSEGGRFPTDIVKNIQDKIAQNIIVDRKMLVLRAKLLEGVMPLGVDRVNLQFKGQGEHASLKITTPGAENEVTEDEFNVYREFTTPPPEGEDTTEVAVNRAFLANILDHMEGTTTNFQYCKRFFVIEDELGEEGGLERSALLTTKTIAQAEAEEAKEREEAKKKEEEEAKAKEEAKKKEEEEAKAEPEAEEATAEPVAAAAEN